MFVLYLHAFVHYLAELLDLFNRLVVSFLHLFDYLERSVLLTEDTVDLVSALSSIFPT